LSRALAKACNGLTLLPMEMDQAIGTGRWVSQTTAQPGNPAALKNVYKISGARGVLDSASTAWGRGRRLR